MSKWINDRAWTVSMYICYALCFIILCVAGYNFILLICIILFVGFGVSMVFSIFITPLSEILSRFLWYLFRLKTKKGISPDCDSERNALKEEFVQKYVRKDYKQSPIYEVFESLFDQEKSGTFAARAFKCALSAPNWLNNYPGYTDARRLFPHEDAIKGTKSNYSNANNEKNCSKEIMETINKLLEDKLKEMIDKSETQQN